MIKKGYAKHIFICENVRDASSPQKSCGNQGSAKITTEFKKHLARRQLTETIRANKSGCLGMCEFGPTVVIYPQGVWYGGVTVDDVADIFERSVLGDEVIDRLLIHAEETTSTRGENA